MEAREIRLDNWVNIGMKDVNGQVISILKNEIHNWVNLLEGIELVRK